MSKCLKQPFVNSIKQTINVGDPVVIVTTGYSHHVTVKQGTYRGLVNGQPSCSYEDTYNEYVLPDGTMSLWCKADCTIRKVKVTRTTTARLGRVFKLDLGKSNMNEPTVVPVDKKISKDEISKLLADRVTQVTFKKVNGETRIMDCTTNMQLIPPSAWPSDNKPQASNSDKTLRVYDVKAEGWRSFLVENVISVI